MLGEVSLLESAIDFQLEIFTTFLNNGLHKPERSKRKNAHSLLEAPYGFYQSQNGYLAIAMSNLEPLLDLLVQAISGITWLSGNESDGPIPMGLAIADIFDGSDLTQGILTGLYQKAFHGLGCRIEVSLLESIFDCNLRCSQLILTMEAKIPIEPKPTMLTHI
jgi:crotonobetainyl-CoA:carnitine CoA-transferase CaiB-like acyl-CoA transferase